MYFRNMSHKECKRYVKAIYTAVIQKKGKKACLSRFEASMTGPSHLKMLQVAQVICRHKEESKAASYFLIS